MGAVVPHKYMLQLLLEIYKEQVDKIPANEFVDVAELPQKATYSLEQWRGIL